MALEEDRRRAAMQKADTEYLSREIASLRIAVGEVATRDFVRSELTRLIEEMDEAAARRHRHDRKEQRKEIKRAARLAVEEVTVEDQESDYEEDEEHPPPEVRTPRASRG
jgi:uncharacterized membrane protein